MTALLPDETRIYRLDDPSFQQHEGDALAYIRRYEKLPAKVFRSSHEGSIFVATLIADEIRKKTAQGKNCVLGLATGSTPLATYEELVRMHREEHLSFKNVITFNLDEYFPIHPESLQSYRRFMREYLFGSIDILPENIHIPDGSLPKEEVYTFCRDYEEKIAAAGGIDLQILGIGRTGHIGFNEPGSSRESGTRLITLDHLTRTDAASDFYGEENVPQKAITMGVGTIMRSRRVVLMAWGEGKADIIRKSVEGEITGHVPGTYLQQHPDPLIVLDRAAAAELTRFKTPWIAGTCRWEERLVRKAVVWLCQQVGKPILKLTDRDYNDNGMSDLVTGKGPSNKINIQVFNDLQHTLTGWPGGKPNADDSTRPERALPHPKTVLVLSPHPDDDVISMGGTLARLVEQGHNVHVAYQTSGSIAVFDDDVIRFLDFIQEYKGILPSGIHAVDKKYKEVVSYIRGKQPGQGDAPDILRIKSAIRRAEALSACRYVGIPPEKVHFLELPFYETGMIKKNPLGEADIRIVAQIIEQLKPHQLYAAGDLSDPHGTHRVCLQAIMQALTRLHQEKWMQECRIWLYRGAWQEWDLDQVDMAVPLSPEEVILKRRAIFKHQSQKDRPLFPGIDDREFWQRAEDRNHATALMYDKLGMAEYQAIEVFVRLDQQVLNNGM